MKLSPVYTNSEVGRPTLMVAFVIIPYNVNIQDYKDTVFNTNKVSVKTENGATIHNVVIPKNTVKDLTFPINKTSFGSKVLIGNVTPQMFPVVIAIFETNSMNTITNEFSFDFLKKFEDASVNIHGDAKDRSLNINLKGGKIPSDINISATDEQKKSKIAIRVTGESYNENENHSNLTRKDFSIVVRKDDKKDTKQTILKILVEEGFTYIDEFDNEFIINKDLIKIKSINGQQIEIGKKVKIGSDSGKEEKAVLGETLKGIKEETNQVTSNLIKSLQEFATTQASASSASPLTPLSAGFTSLAKSMVELATELEKINSKLDTILSENILLD